MKRTRARKISLSPRDAERLALVAEELAATADWLRLLALSLRGGGTRRKRTA